MPPGEVLSEEVSKLPPETRCPLSVGGEWRREEKSRPRANYLESKVNNTWKPLERISRDNFPKEALLKKTRTKMESKETENLKIPVWAL